MNKTNAMRILDSEKATYIAREYDEEITDGEMVAKAVGIEPDRVFKTLVTVGKTGNHYVFVVPVEAELDLKKAAKAAGEKSIEMIKQKELLPLTGYVHGGCSPIGMKKPFKTFIHESAPNYDKVFVSAGKVGFQIELSPADLIAVTGCAVADII